MECKNILKIFVFLGQFFGVYECLGAHEWFIEFEDKPNNLDLFSKDLDKNLQELNTYYKDLITGKVLQPLKVSPLKKGAFRKYMSSIGKLGGQNKVPRLSNDRKIAERPKTAQYRIP